MGKGRSWTTKEFDLLRSMVKEGKSNQEIANMLGRTLKAVNFKKRQLNVTRQRWTKEQERMLREMVGQGMTVRQIAFEIGKSISAVKEKKSRMGLRLSKDHIDKIYMDNRISFSKEEYRAMRSDYEDTGDHRMKCSEIAMKYNLSDQVLKRIARERGWKRKSYYKRKPPLDFTALYKAYYEDCMSINQIRKMFRCSSRRVEWSIEEHGLVLLPQEERIKIRDEFKDTGKHFGTWRDKLEAIK